MGQFSTYACPAGTGPIVVSAFWVALKAMGGLIRDGGTTVSGSSEAESQANRTGFERLATGGEPSASTARYARALRVEGGQNTGRILDDL